MTCFTLFYHFFGVEYGWMYQIITLAHTVSVVSSEASRRLFLQLLATANLGTDRAISCGMVRPLTRAQDHVQLRNALRALGLILDAKFHSIFGQDKAGGCATFGGVMVETCGKHAETCGKESDTWVLKKLFQGWYVCSWNIFFGITSLE